MTGFRAALLAAALASFGAPAVSAPPPAGYLTAQTAPDAIFLLPPPPANGSSAASLDRDAFSRTRALEGQARWTMATQDAAVSPDALMGDFACAIGARLDQAHAPTLYALLARTLRDERLVVDPPKTHYARPRPFLAQHGDICVARSDDLVKSGSYPSGHSTLSWSWGLVLAELAPDRASQILARARVYGESRVVCGVHYPSDIEAGRANGAALAAALHGSAEFRADMDKARAEVAAARASRSSPAPDPARCKIEADAEAHQPW